MPRDGRPHRRGAEMLFPFLVILPGIAALGLTPDPTPGTAPLLPTLADGTYDYNMALPLMMSRTTRRVCLVSA